MNKEALQQVLLAASQGARIQLRVERESSPKITWHDVVLIWLPSEANDRFYRVHPDDVVQEKSSGLTLSDIPATRANNTDFKKGALWAQDFLKARGHVSIESIRVMLNALTNRYIEQGVPEAELAILLTAVCDSEIAITGAKP